MGKSILVPGGNFKSLRSGMISSLIPQKLSGLTNLWMAPKFIGNVLMNIINDNDLSKPANEYGRIYNLPALRSSPSLKNKVALNFIRNSGSDGGYLRGACQLTKDWSIHLCYANSSIVTGGAVFSINNSSEYIRLITVRGNGTSGLLCFGVPDVIELFADISTSREIISIQKLGGKLTIWRNGVKLISDQSVPDYLPFTTLNLGGYDGLSGSAGGLSSFTPFAGDLAYISTYNSILSDPEITALHSQLAVYY